MSFIKLNKSLFETASIVLRHKVEYESILSNPATSLRTDTDARSVLKRQLNVKNTDVNSSITHYSDASVTNNLNNPNNASGDLGLLTSVSDTLRATTIASFPDANLAFNGKGFTPTSVQPLIFEAYSAIPSVNTINYITGVFYDYDAQYMAAINPAGGVTSFPQQNSAHPTISSTVNLATDLNIPNAVDTILGGGHRFYELKRSDVSTDGETPISIFRIGKTGLPLVKDTSVEKLGSRAILRKADLKKTIADHLMPHYKTNYNNCDMSYTNFNCLNFFYDPDNHTGQEVLVYNSGNRSYLGRYSDAGSSIQNTDRFTFSCWINPKYKNHTADGDMNTGTIFHASSSLAISLVTGSNRDEEGYTDHYRLMVQLKHSAAKNPSSFLVTGSSNRIDNGRYPHDLIYLTDDNSIKRNTWNYISVKWGRNINDNQLTLRINDKNYKYTIPSASIGEHASFGSETTTGIPYAFIGNYYDGAAAQTHKYFSENKALLDFARKVGSSANANPVLLNTQLINQYQGELHELRVHGEYLSDKVEEDYRYTSFDDTNDKHIKHGLNLYIPVNYDSMINTEKRKSNNSGVVLFNPSLQGGKFTPSNGIDINNWKYNTPTNIFISHGVGGKYVNLHNFTMNAGRSRVFTNNAADSAHNYVRPIHYQMSASLIVHTVNTDNSLLSTRDSLQNQGSVVKRNNLIAPCDNGYFRPNYYQEKMTCFRNQNDLGNESYETVSLRNMTSGSLLQSREFPIYYLTRDNMSNDMSAFFISNLYYGERIHPGSLTITDSSILGTSDKVKYTIKDDGKGSLYRADSDGDHAKWASVGNIFYDEGVVLIKSPHMPYFGKNRFKIEFKGEQTTHVTTVHVPCPEELYASSSNPTYKLITGSLDEANKNNPFVYITGINIHDDNLNVIMKCKLAQPVKKRKTDSYLFRLKQDY